MRPGFRTVVPKMEHEGLSLSDFVSSPFSCIARHGHLGGARSRTQTMFLLPVRFRYEFAFWNKQGEKSDSSPLIYRLMHRRYTPLIIYPSNSCLISSRFPPISQMGSLDSSFPSPTSSAMPKKSARSFTVSFLIMMRPSGVIHVLCIHCRVAL